MKLGDLITCSDVEDLINTMNELERSEIHTDFDYRTDKPRLVVIGIDEE